MAGVEGAFGWGGDGQEGGPPRGSGGGGNGILRRRHSGELRRRAPAEDLRWKEESEMGATVLCERSGDGSLP